MHALQGIDAPEGNANRGVDALEDIVLQGTFGLRGKAGGLA
jgi:hypothetical protein